MKHVYLYNDAGFFVSKVVNTVGLKNTTPLKPKAPASDNIQRFVNGIWEEVNIADKDSEKALKIISSNESKYYMYCYKYQVDNIDMNLFYQMITSECLVKDGSGVESDFPMAKANRDWLDSLWAFYYTEKTKMLAGEEYSSDFKGAVGVVPHSYAEVTNERQEFEAGGI